MALGWFLRFIAETCLSSRVSSFAISLSSFSLMPGLVGRCWRALKALTLAARLGSEAQVRLLGAWVSTSMSASGGGMAGSAIVGPPGSPALCLFGFSSFRSFRVFTSADKSCIWWLFRSCGTPGAKPLAERRVTGAVEPSTICVHTSTIRISWPRSRANYLSDQSLSVSTEATGEL